MDFLEGYLHKQSLASLNKVEPCGSFVAIIAKAHVMLGQRPCILMCNSQIYSESRG